MHACELLAVEHQLDRIDAELAAELPSHLRAFAHAYARGERPPPAPAAVLRPATLATARLALAHPLLADRGLALVRLALPAAIDSDSDVAAAHAAPASWSALAALTRARDAAAAQLWPLASPSSAIDRLHRLHGLDDPAVRPADKADPAPGDGATSPFVVPHCLPAAIDGWTVPDGVIVDEHAALRAWHALAANHGVTGTMQLVHAAVRPRTFVIAPGREVLVVVPAEIATPADRFAVLHELGHALAALAVATGLPRPIDEAAAAYAARAIERPGRWFSPAAAAARHRRLLLAHRLDELERSLPAIADRFTAQPPWALWHDPGAQAAYVAAEALADELTSALGPSPPAGAFAAALTAQRDQLDRRAGRTLGSPRG